MSGRSWIKDKLLFCHFQTSLNSQSNIQPKKIITYSITLPVRITADSCGSDWIVQSGMKSAPGMKLYAKLKGKHLLLRPKHLRPPKIKLVAFILKLLPSESKHLCVVVADLQKKAHSRELAKSVECFLWQRLACVSWQNKPPRRRGTIL